MAKEHVLYQLIKHDITKRKRRVMSRQWKMAYMAVIIVIAIVAATYASLKGNIDIQYTWYFTLGLPFAVFGITIGLTAKEWKNGTVGWWLSLPYPRSRLILSKCTAGFIRGLIVFIFVYVAVSLFSLYIMLLHGDFALTLFLQFIESGLKWFALLIGVSPFMSTLGILFAVLRESRARPAIPLFWIFWSGTWWLVANVYGNKFATYSPLDLSLSYIVVVLIAASWIAAYLIIRLSTYLLDRQLAFINIHLPVCLFA